EPYREQYERDHEVRRRSGEDHERTLPRRLRAERPRILLRGRLLVRVHAGDTHVAAEGQRFHAVLRLASPDRPQARAEPDEELLHLDLEQLGEAEVRGL